MLSDKIKLPNLKEVYTTKEKIIENAKCYSSVCTEHLKELYAIYRADCAGRIMPEETYSMSQAVSLQ